MLKSIYVQYVQKIKEDAYVWLITELCINMSLDYLLLGYFTNTISYVEPVDGKI